MSRHILTQKKKRRSYDRQPCCRQALSLETRLKQKSALKQNELNLTTTHFNITNNSIKYVSFN